ncbi:hypothetical protein [Oceanirhabdus seepicola]|uniref:Uncharacterized protein n=1 Tax=Oceanirhabdus seepicola TaxID=2828781 RepID=A0A9J6P007_9CLOT|nr:hypothetical protein [Oceanirhabdus seepicola]MCM1989534.1 hypothetical protein [Oceanirhabdus seepicola]
MTYKIILFFVIPVAAVVIFIFDYNLRKKKDYSSLNIEKDNVINECKFWKVHRNQSILKLISYLIFAIYPLFFTINPYRTLIMVCFCQIPGIYYWIAKRKLLI